MFKDKLPCPWGLYLSLLFSAFSKEFLEKKKLMQFLMEMCQLKIPKSLFSSTMDLLLVNLCGSFRSEFPETNKYWLIWENNV